MLWGPKPTRTGWARVGQFFLWLLSGEFKLWALGTLAGVFGIWLLVRQELSVAYWRTTEGVVLESEVEWIEDPPSETSPPIAARVRYRYRVDGIDYQSSRITLGEPKTFYFLEEAKKFAKRFPVGAQIPVLYAPYNPSEATLFAKRTYSAAIPLGNVTGCPSLLANFNSQNSNLW